MARSHDIPAPSFVSPDVVAPPVILLIHADAEHLVALEMLCRTVGVPVVGVARIADLEKWPFGQIVITDAAHVTPWWRRVGAQQVIAVVSDEAAGEEAVRKGATGWLRHPVLPAAVAALVQGV